MSDFKETAILLIPKEHLAFMKDDKGFKEYIVNRLSSELANRIMGILEREEEIIISQSDLRAREHMPTNSVEYKRQINWSPLVRCKDCKYGIDWDGRLGCEWHGFYRTEPNWFCADGKRKDDE